MLVDVGAGSGERKRKESDEQIVLRPAQRWVVDQRSWSPLGRKARSVEDEETNSKNE